MSEEDDVKARRDAAMEAFIARQDEERAERKPAQPAAPRVAPAGWYPHPSMAGTQRYWDGEKWTDHVAPSSTQTPAPRRTPATQSKLAKKISWAVAFIFLIPILLLTLNSPTIGDHDCGTWFNWRFDSIEILSQETDVLTGASSEFSSAAEVDLTAAACNEKLSTQRTIALILLGLGAGCRIAIPIIARAFRE